MAGLTQAATAAGSTKTGNERRKVLGMRRPAPMRQFILKAELLLLPLAAVAVFTSAFIAMRSDSVALLGRVLGRNSVPLPPPPSRVRISSRVGSSASSKVHYLKARTAKLTDDVDEGEADDFSPPSRTKEDHAFCAIPGMAGQYGVDCTKFNEHDSFHGKQRSRPLMKVPEDEVGNREWDDSEWESKGQKDWEGWKRETRVVKHPGAGNIFPYEKSSPVGDLDEGVRGALKELKKKLDLGHGEPRGGLQKSGGGHTRTEQDILLCAIPGLAEVYGVECEKVNEGDDFEGSQRARPLMEVPSKEEASGDDGSAWEGDTRETKVVDHQVAGTNYPYEQGSPVGELEDGVRGKLQELKKLLDEGHNGEPRGGLEEPSSVGAGRLTRDEADAAICGVPILADIFRHLCVGVNRKDAIDYGKQRHRPLYHIPGGDGGSSIADGERHDDDSEGAAINEPVPGQNFPYERWSPAGKVDGFAGRHLDKMGNWVMGLGHKTEPRGGLEEAEERWVRQGHDHWVCTIPILAELFGGFKCKGFVYPAGHHSEGRQQHRPLMPARLSEEEEERRRVQEEGRRLRERAEAVDAAEDKMGKYYGAPSWTATQPKDRIVPAEDGETQESSWLKVKRFVNWLRANLPGFPEWKWWKGQGPAAPCGERDIACGADLTLHAPRDMPSPAKMAPFLSPFAGVPITVKRYPPGKPVPCLHPFCDSPHVGQPKVESREQQRRMRSIFAGKPIGPTNAHSAGEPVPCLHPFCDSTASLHKPVHKAPEKPFRFIPFTAGRPIRPRGGKGTGDAVPCVGPTCNSAPYIHDEPKPRASEFHFANPLAGSPIRAEPHAKGAPVDFTVHPWRFRSPFAGYEVGTHEPKIPWDHKGTFTFPGGKGWHGPKGAGEHIGGLEDVHYPAGRVRPWMFRQVYPGQQLRKLEGEGAGRGRARGRARRQGEGEGGGGGAGFGDLLKGIWQVPPRDIASAAV